MLRAIEIVLLAVLVLCTAALLIARGTRFAAVLAIRALLFAVVVAGVVCYVSG